MQGAGGAVGEAQKDHGPEIGGADAPVGIDAQHAGADPAQHGLDELTPLLCLVTGRLQGRLLALKIRRHPIEGMGQNGDLLEIVVQFHAGRQVPHGHPVRREHEPGHRRGNLAGDPHPDPHGPHQHQQGRVGIAEQEDRLNRVAAGEALLVFPHRLLGGPKLLRQARFKGPRHIEEGVGRAAEAIDCAHHVIIVEPRPHLARGFGCLEGGGRGDQIGGRGRSHGPGQDPSPAIHHIDGGKAPLQSLVEEDGIGDRVFFQQVGHHRAVEGGGQHAHLPGQDRGLLVHDGVAEQGPALHRRLHPAGEPVVHAPGHQQAEEHRDDDRRCHGGQGEQADETAM